LVLNTLDGLDIVDMTASRPLSLLFTIDFAPLPRPAGAPC